MERPIICVDFCDLGPRVVKSEHWLFKILQERFGVRLTTSPDFVFYGDGGEVHRMYTCVRIYVGGCESDFRECDYAIVVGGNGKWKMEDGKPTDHLPHVEDGTFSEGRNRKSKIENRKPLTSSAQDDGYRESIIENRKPANDERVLRIDSAGEVNEVEKQEILSFFANVFSDKTEPTGAKNGIFGRWVLVKKNA